MKNKIITIIQLLSEISAKDLDDLSVEELAQFHYWLVEHQGAVFVKSVGRLGKRIEGARAAQALAPREDIKE